MQGILNRTNLVLTSLFVMLMVAVLSVPALAQANDLGTEALQATTGAIGKAVLVAAAVIGFAVLYKIIRRVTG